MTNLKICIDIWCHLVAEWHHSTKPTYVTKVHHSKKCFGYNAIHFVTAHFYGK